MDRRFPRHICSCVHPGTCLEHTHTHANTHPKGLAKVWQNLKNKTTQMMASNLVEHLVDSWPSHEVLLSKSAREMQVWGILFRWFQGCSPCHSGEAEVRGPSLLEEVVLDWPNPFKALITSVSSSKRSSIFFSRSEWEFLNLSLTRSGILSYFEQAVEIYILYLLPQPPQRKRVIELFQDSPRKMNQNQC